jgi:hypothetical protein
MLNFLSPFGQLSVFHPLLNGDYNIHEGGALFGGFSSVQWSYCRIKTPQVGQTQVSVRIADGPATASFCLKTEVLKAGVMCR